MTPLRVQRILPRLSCESPQGTPRSTSAKQYHGGPPPRAADDGQASLSQQPVSLTLPYEKRQKSRLVCTLSDGRTALLLLPRGHVLAGGTLLEAEDGTRIEVKSAPEQLSRATASDSRLLMAIAYHLGNRHVALQVNQQELLYEHDHVLDDMVRGLGGSVQAVVAPFEPEPGAYRSAHSHAATSHSHNEGGAHEHE